MLSGPWLPENPHQLDFQALPKLPSEHAVISDVSAKKGVNQHNYLAHHDGQFWVMWSDGPGIEDRVGQRVVAGWQPGSLSCCRLLLLLLLTRLLPQAEPLLHSGWCLPAGPRSWRLGHLQRLCSSRWLLLGLLPGRLRLRLPLAADYARGQRCRLRLRPGEPARLFPGGLELSAAAEVPQVL